MGGQRAGAAGARARGGVRPDLPAAAGARRPSGVGDVPVSSGRGATTCSFFLPGDREVIYASTEAGGAACPPKPDHSQGYVWALYPDYDIYRANADGSGARRLTTTPGYDAEGTVCGKDGSIVFTSTRDGDIELYRMDADGKNVKRLTHDPGYDGGAFFNADCSQIVWRASRPKPGKELDDYKRLLGQNLVRPSKLELYVTDADGSDAHQVTYLDAASFGPVHARRAAHDLLVERRRSARARVRPLGDRRRRHAPRADHRRARLRRLPDVLARRQAAGVRVEPRDRARRARHQRVRRRLEARRCRRRPPARTSRRARRPDPGRRALAGRSGARGARHRHRRARGGGRVHRGALPGCWASSPPATTAATGRRFRCAPA